MRRQIEMHLPIAGSYCIGPLVFVLRALSRLVMLAARCGRSIGEMFSFETADLQAFILSAISGHEGWFQRG
jgi:hypothetical protein